MHNQSSAAITRFTSHQRVASMLVKTSPQSEEKLFIHLVIIIPYEPTMARNDCREALLSPALLPPPNTRVKSESVHKLLPTSWAVNCVQECREPLLGAMTADASLTVSRCNHSATHQLTTSERTWIRQTPTWMRCYLFPNCNMEMTLTRVLLGYCQKKNETSVDGSRKTGIAVKWIFLVRANNHVWVWRVENVQPVLLLPSSGTV